MVMNLEKIVPSPYFRTYWVQRNITDMKQYSTAVSDVFRSHKQYREERVLLRKTPPASIAAEGLEVAAGLARLVPENAGLYIIKADPSAGACADLIETELLASHLDPAPASEIAPRLQLTSGETGTDSDLETRIDQPVVEGPVAPQGTSAVRALFGTTQMLASLQVQSTERDPSGVFIRTHSAIVVAAASDWNEARVQAALADFVRADLTTSDHGVIWQQRSGYAELDGLSPLVTSVRGHYLLIADDPTLIDSVLANFNHKSDVKPAVFIAGFNHQREQANFARFSAVVDRPNLAPSNSPGMERQPQFFSENMVSLSSALARISAEKIIVHDEGNKVLQTVTYEWVR
jgi:hypothetical protein